MNSTHCPLRILVVEDHASTNEVLAKMLAKAGHVSTAVKCAADALHAFRDRSFDLVICDIGLPDASGWELLKKLRAVRRDFRAIALTGHCFPRDLALSSEAGFDLHITKPAEWGTIDQAVLRLFPPGSAPAAAAPAGGSWRDGFRDFPDGARLARG